MPVCRRIICNLQVLKTARIFVESRASPIAPVLHAISHPRSPHRARHASHSTSAIPASCPSCTSLHLRDPRIASILHAPSPPCSAHHIRAACRSTSAIRPSRPACTRLHLGAQRAQPSPQPSQIFCLSMLPAPQLPSQPRSAHPARDAGQLTSAIRPLHPRAGSLQFHHATGL